MDVWNRAGRNKAFSSTPTQFVASFSPCCHQGLMFEGGQGEGGCLLRDCGYELIQGWLRHSPAEALFSGTISSMGRRKWVKWPASSCAQPYFSTSTSNRDHGFSLVMCRSSPAGDDRKKSQWSERSMKGQKTAVFKGLVHPNDNICSRSKDIGDSVLLLFSTNPSKKKTKTKYKYCLCSLIHTNYYNHILNHNRLSCSIIMIHGLYL